MKKANGMFIIANDGNNRVKADVRYNQKLKPTGVMLYLENKLDQKIWQGSISFYLSLDEIEKLSQIKNELEDSVYMKEAGR